MPYLAVLLLTCCLHEIIPFNMFYYLKTPEWFSFSGSSPIADWFSGSQYSLLIGSANDITDWFSDSNNRDRLVLRLQYSLLIGSQAPIRIAETLTG